MMRSTLFPILLAMALLPSCSGAGRPGEAARAAEPAAQPEPAEPVEPVEPDAGGLVAGEIEVPSAIAPIPTDDLDEMREWARRRGVPLEQGEPSDRDLGSDAVLVDASDRLEAELVQEMADATAGRAAGGGAAGAERGPDLPAGFFRVADQARLEGDHRYYVHREYGSAREAEWIRLAESQPPCPEAYGSALAPGEKRRPYTGPWWGGEWCVTPPAVALTTDAVEHYLKLSKNLGDPSTARKTKQEFPDEPLSSTLIYRAEVERGGDHATVEIGIRWADACGGRCAWGFLTTRVVVIGTGTGDVLECYDNLIYVERS